MNTFNRNGRCTSFKYKKESISYDLNHNSKAKKVTRFIYLDSKKNTNSNINTTTTIKGTNDDVKKFVTDNSATSSLIK